MEFGPKMMAAIEKSRVERVVAVRVANVDPPAPPPPDTKPIVFVTLHGTAIVRGAKVVTPAMRTVPFTWRTIKAWPSGALGFLRLLRSFLRTVTGGLISRSEHRNRQDGCRDCPKRIVIPVVRRTMISKGKRVAYIQEKSYCGLCKCAKWFLARLDIKNWFKRWKCPLRRHAGPYPDDVERHWLVENGHATAKQLQPDGGSCGGCGSR